MSSTLLQYVPDGIPFSKPKGREREIQREGEARLLVNTICNTLARVLNDRSIGREREREKIRVGVTKVVHQRPNFTGGHSTFFGLLNTFVHIVMYTYYLLAAMGPGVQPYLWWKKYLTAFQMVQFIAIIVHAFQLLFIECNYPKAFVWWIGLHAIMFLFLFNEFYQQSYQERKPRKPAGAVLANGAATTAAAVANNDYDQSKGKHAANGSVTNGSVTNGIANGVANGSSLRRRDAADYYVKGESLTTELNLRKPSYATNIE